MLSENPRTSAPSDEIVAMRAVDLSRAIHDRSLSCVDVMTAYLAQVARMNHRVNALVSLVDADALLGEARRADTELGACASRGWMHGFPMAPKETASVAGMVTARGSPIYRDTVTQEDNLTISRLRNAGAIFIGRSNVPEFALGSHTFNTVYGTTGNAFDPSRSSGGSSGGAAVALALHMLPVADGGDMMGSLRNPAAFNNIVALRPTIGRVPSNPVDDVFCDLLSTNGPMARNVADLAMLLSVQAGCDPALPLSCREDPAIFTGALNNSADGLRIGWLGDLGGYLAMELEVTEVCERALKNFEAIGCEVTTASIEFPMERLWRAWTTLRSFHIAGERRALYENPAHRALLKAEMIWEIESGNALTARDVHEASVARTDWFRAITGLFAEFDFLVLPSAQLFPFDAALRWPTHVAGRAMDTYHRWMEVVVPSSMSGLPALNLPAGFSRAGLPMGLQVIGPWQADWQLLQLGHRYEHVCEAASVESPLLSA